MTKKRQTPQERLNDPNAMFQLFAGMQLAMFVGVLIGTWIKSATFNELYFDVLAPYLLFTWVPTALVIAIVGIILFKRAKRISAQGRKE